MLLMTVDGLPVVPWSFASLALWSLREAVLLFGVLELSSWSLVPCGPRLSPWLPSSLLLPADAAEFLDVSCVSCALLMNFFRVALDSSVFLFCCDCGLFKLLQISPWTFVSRSLLYF
ncbi:hypothetical protein NPIL_45141 [Nephila pilipes]|uniref:Uncharacterized protein n=1 Tax=Nephila pilipes TaxID=299642 RepID=A0A8X6TQ87_NEPPI|nr:hypothetical protein NPIL_45141 [Nephila pilipes]